MLQLDQIYLDFAFDQHPWYLLSGLAALAFSVLVLLFYYFVFFSRLAFRSVKPAVEKTILPSVSLVIAACNEYLNLEENIPLWCNQNYPDYEVIIVDDNSSDESWELLCDMKLRYPRLKPVQLESNVHFFKGKKFPLSVGITSAKNEWLLMTDADCAPASGEWMRQMMLSATSNSNMVLGVGKYYRKRRLLNWIIRYDTFHIALQYLSAALSGFPYMGVGRNLSYKRELFVRTGGFTSHYNIQSGDDDLFVNAHASKLTTNVCVQPAAFTFSRSKSSFRKYFYQKKRHLTTGKYYRAGHKFFLGFYHFNIMLFWLMAPLIICLQYNILIAAAFILLKIIGQWVVFGFAAGKLKERKLLLISPLMEVFFAFFNPIVHFSNIIRKPDKWK